jgi:hypothetical protein
MTMSLQQRSAIGFLLALLLVGLWISDVPTTNAQSGGDQNIEVISQYGGWITDVETVGNYSYAAGASRLVVLDIVDSANPVRLGQFDLLQYNTSLGFIDDILVVGQHVYIATSTSDRGQSALVVVDISDPLNPQAVGFYLSADDHFGPWRMATVGSYLYLVEHMGTTILDISNPTAPSRTGRVEVSGTAVSAINQLLYVKFGDDLTILDTSNPSSPSEVGHYDGPSDSATAYDGLEVVEPYAYLTAVQGLRVLDVSNPASPSEAGFLEILQGSLDVATNGSNAFVGTRDGLIILDVSDPAMPRTVGHYYAPDSVASVDVVGEYAYLAAEDAGLRIVDVSNLSAPNEIGSYSEPTSSSALMLTNGYTYIADGESGLRIVDVSNPTQPEPVGLLDTPDFAQDVFISDTLAYVTNRNLASSDATVLQIIDVSQPSTPEVVGRLGASGDLESARSISVVGNHAYVGTADSGFHIVNVSNSSNPTRQQIVYYGDGRYDSVIVDDHLYLASVALFVYRPIADGLDFVSRYDVDGAIVDVAVAGNYAYVAEQDNGNPESVGGLRILDLSNPAEPQQIGAFDIVGTAKAVAVEGDYAYFVDEETGLHIVDVSNPAAPRQIAVLDALLGGNDLTVSEQLIYVVGGNGLTIFRFTPPEPTAISLSHLKAGPTRYLLYLSFAFLLFAVGTGIAVRRHLFHPSAKL